MDPHSFIARAEAQRWLGLAEKLLMGRDLVGSKTFAIRARESDPRLEVTDQILAIVDTLMAADKRVGVNNNQPDWYSILQLVHLTHDSELIASQYRRLALLLNPSQTQLPYADQAFQLVSEAWSVLSNPMRKSIYDNELNYSQHQQQQQQFNPIGFTHEVQQHQQQQQHQNYHQQPVPPPPPQPPQQQQHQQHNFFSNQNVVGSSREQERPERPFVIRPHQQHNFLSQQPNLAGAGREADQPTRPSFQSRPTQQPQQQTQQQQRQRPPVQPQIQSPPQSQPQPQPKAQPQPQPQPQAPIQPQPQPKAKPQPPPQASMQHQPQPQAKPRPPPQAPIQPQPQQPLPPPPQQEVPNTTPTPIRQENSDGVGGNENASSEFWTACPFCFYMYEYLRVYEECTLRCENCKRAFQAVAVQPPPLEGKEAYYYCWGFFPLGISKTSFEKNKGNGSNWAPFSAMFAGPRFDKMKRKRNYHTGPRLYIDDVVDDVFWGISEPSDDSDIGWRSISTRKKKKKKKVKKTVKSGTRKKGSGRPKGSFNKNKSGVAINPLQSVNLENGENEQEEFPVQEDVVVPIVPEAEASNMTETRRKAETSKKAAGPVPRRQSGRGGKELGKLDLNVEFNNNDGEEPAPGMSAGNRGGHREEDNIEGIGFFEGLDEFLSSLPILSVVGDDKVKAA